MALAENHRTALKMEATCIAAATTGTSNSASAGTGGGNAGSSPTETNQEYSGFSSAESSAGNRCHRHQYSDMLNQVYTSHLHAQLSHPGSNSSSSSASKGTSHMFGGNSQTSQAAFGGFQSLLFVK